jgi:hypothetical protein
MVFAFRQVTPDERWHDTEKYIRISFWGLNGLAIMILSSLFPGGVLQLYDVLQKGYWHARSAAFGHSMLMHTLEWARLPGDLIFIAVGAVLLVIAALKTYFCLYRTPDPTRERDRRGRSCMNAATLIHCGSDGRIRGIFKMSSLLSPSSRATLYGRLFIQLNN